jgi:RNA:NAD 2'-phosphotransferase (TPT1/KptA family)
MKGTNTLQQHKRKKRKNSKGTMDSNQKDVYGKAMSLLLRDNIKVSINQYFFHSY